MIGTLLRRCAGLALLSLAAGVWAQGGPLAVPALGARVTDLTGTLSADQARTLEAELRDFEARKGSQIAVLIVATTQPETIEQYGIRVADAWKLGRKKVDDGAILLIAKNDRTLRIEVGYGLEGALNDAVCERIISEIIVPRFQQGDFDGGVNAGVAAILKVVDGEPLPAARPLDPPRETNYRQLLPLAFMAILFVGGILRALLGRLLGAIVAGGVIAAGTYLLFHFLVVGILLGIVAFFITLASGSLGMTGMMFGGFGGGGGGGGSGGGGGFGGGGGGFGGGGASGRW